MTYQECLDSMYALRRFGIILGLDIIKTLTKQLDNPHEQFNSIHIAGTNGKGSIASGLAFILNLCGYKTGLFTSPHLVRFNERICVNNQYISDHEVVEAYQAVRDAVTEREPTFFEYCTAMAMHHFAVQKVDWAIIETGMGGRLDATNVITPVISIISNISIEHKFYLGNTLAQIAGEKAGIIKPEVPVITGAHQNQVLAVLKKQAEHHSAPLYCLRKDFKVRRKTKDRHVFNYFGISKNWREMCSGLAGAFQTDNAALILAACELLLQAGFNLTEENIRTGLLQNHWPGRLEFISQKPCILLDGAHNLEAAKNLASFLSHELAEKQITLVIGILDDKPYQKMLNLLAPLCKKLILTCARNERSLPLEKLHKAVQDYKNIDIMLIDDVAQAVQTALNNADTVCIAGSLYVVGEAKIALASMGFNNLSDLQGY